MAVLTGVFIGRAWGWETDPITDRGHPIADGTAAANAYVDELLDQALAEVNERTRCGLDPEAQRQAVARAIFEATSQREHVHQRGPLRGQGFGTYAAWLETSPEIDRRDFHGRSDLFKGIPFFVAPVLSSVGTCSLVHLAGVLMGTDKPDHFFYGGYWYDEIVQRTGSVQRAVDYGTKTERSYYGLATSSTFSFADLHANWQGFRFFSGLFGPESIIQRGADGCAVRVGDFDWSDWADWRWDEALNPNVYRRRVEGFIDGRLVARAGPVCAELGDGLDDIEAHVAQAVDEPHPWAGPRAPVAHDAFELGQLCRGEPIAPVTGGPSPTRPASKVARVRARQG